MKRSQVNQVLNNAIAFAHSMNLSLPPFAYWGPEEWSQADSSYQEVVDNMLGWDVTDFGKGDFATAGLTTFTFRNGNFNDKDKYPKPYCEKLLVLEDGQELPFHFHWSKMEDTINRGGGNLIIQFFNATEDEKFSDSDVHIKKDGRSISLPAGGQVVLHPGESVTATQGIYHRWLGEPGTGKVLVFEVSMTNDDFQDNRFYESLERIPDFEEDVKPTHLVFNDYNKYFQVKA
jgi:D-lyxose ketol-isomerase